MHLLAYQSNLKLNKVQVTSELIESDYTNQLVIKANFTTGIDLGLSQFHSIHKSIILSLVNLFCFYCSIYNFKMLF